MRQRVFPILSFLLLGVLILFVIWVGSSVTEGTGLEAGPARPPRPTATPALPRDQWPSRTDLSDVTKNEIQPNLVVENIDVAPAIPYLNSPTAITLTVFNKGPAAVLPGNNFFVDFYVDPGLPGSSLPGVTGVISWFAQSDWFPSLGRHIFTATYVFTEPYEHQLYAQVDSPESGLAWYGHVYEGQAGENDNVFPGAGAGIRLAAQPRYSVTQGLAQDFYDNYASSLQVVPDSAPTVYRDIYQHPVTSSAKLLLGLFEEQPIDWGTWASPPDFSSEAYNIVSPDTLVNQVITNTQTNPKIAANPISGSQQIAVVWEDRRFNPKRPDIYIRYAMDQSVDPPVDGQSQHKSLVWRDEIRVNDDGPGSAVHAAPVVAVSENGNVVVAWQDNRLHPNDSVAADIYWQQFRFNTGTHTLDRIGANLKLQPMPGCEGTSSIKPKIAQMEDNSFYLAWEGQCPQSHSNIYVARTAPVSSSGVVNWELWRRVNDADSSSASNPDLGVFLAWTVGSVGTPYYNPLLGRWEVSYTVTRTPYVAVAWEQDKGIDSGTDSIGTDIFASLSLDRGDTFQGDQQINDNDLALPYFERAQHQPAMAFGQDKRDVLLVVGGIEVTIPAAPIPMLHFAWQDFRNSTGCESGQQNPRNCVGNDPDIYYRYCQFMSEDNPNHPPGLYGEACAASTKLNTGDIFAWQNSPPQQRNPAIAVKNYDTVEDRFKYSDVYVAWADNRNPYDAQDAANYDIYLAVPYADATPPYLTDHNTALNDEVKIRPYATEFFTDRTPDRPPAAWQDMPSIAANAYHSERNDDWDSPEVYGAGRETGWLYAVWQDSRDERTTPYNNWWDVYFARSNLTYYQNDDGQWFGSSCPETLPRDRYGAGSYISRAFDAGSPLARWYNIWYDSTKDPFAPSPAIQTRVANTIPDLLTADWWPQTTAITKGCEYPLWGYIDSGANIISDTQTWPQGRYIQYRANFWTRAPGSGKSPELYWVRAYYDFPGTAGGPGGDGDGPGPGTPSTIYLPIIVKQSAP